MLKTYADCKETDTDIAVIYKKYNRDIKCQIQRTLGKWRSVSTIQYDTIDLVEELSSDFWTRMIQRNTMSKFNPNHSKLHLGNDPVKTYLGLNLGELMRDVRERISRNPLSRNFSYDSEGRLLRKDNPGSKQGEYGTFVTTDPCYDLKLLHKKLYKSLNELERKIWRLFYKGNSLRDVCRKIGLSFGTAFNLKSSIARKAKKFSKGYSLEVSWQGEGNGKKGCAPVDY